MIARPLFLLAISILLAGVSPARAQQVVPTPLPRVPGPGQLAPLHRLLLVRQLEAARKWMESIPPEAFAPQPPPTPQSTVSAGIAVRGVSGLERRRKPPTWVRRATAREQNRRHSLDQPDLVLGGIGGRVNDALLNDYLNVLRTYSPERRAAAIRDGAPNSLLDDAQLFRIRLREGHRGTAYRLVDGDVLKPRWPRALRSPEFDVERRAYERALATAVVEAADEGAMSYVAESRLHDAVRTMKSRFLLAHPKHRRTASTDAFHEFRVGREFLDRLSHTVGALEPDDPLLRQRRPEFEGATFGELVEFAIENGLRFAPPSRTDQPTYDRLFVAMHEMVETPEPPEDDDRGDLANVGQLAARPVAGR